MEAYTEANDRVRLLRIDIRSWQSPVARQHGIRSIPHLLLYKDGAQIAAGTRGVMRRMQAEAEMVRTDAVQAAGH